MALYLFIYGAILGIRVSVDTIITVPIEHSNKLITKLKCKVPEIGETGFKCNLKHVISFSHIKDFNYQILLF